MYMLYSHPTPNGIKPTIMLEELAVRYEIEPIDISKNEQFKPEFLKISPNNKIPVLYDKDYDFYLFESVAILEYLAEKHQKFLPINDVKQKYNVLKWCYFQTAHIGPMFGQYGHFHRFSKETVPYAKQRYADEVLRLMAVMEKQLTHNPFISGSEYTIADMAIWPWINCYQEFYKATLDEQKFPHLAHWYSRIGEREAVEKALMAYQL